MHIHLFEFSWLSLTVVFNYSQSQYLKLFFPQVLSFSPCQFIVPSNNCLLPSLPFQNAPSPSAKAIRIEVVRALSAVTFRGVIPSHPRNLTRSSCFPSLSLGILRASLFFLTVIFSCRFSPIVVSSLSIRIGLLDEVGSFPH